MDNYNIESAAEIVVRGGSAGALGGVTSNIDWFNLVSTAILELRAYLSLILCIEIPECGDFRVNERRMVH
jgi:hypothetical protein